MQNLNIFYLFLVWHAACKVSSTEILNVDNQLYRLIRADGDSTTDNPTSGDTLRPPTNTTTAAACQRDGNCCAMYTWPGNRHRDDGDEAPRSCADLAGIQQDKDNTIACFGPIVYSNSTRDLRPDPVAVVELCTLYDYACFCATGSACIKLSFRENNAVEKILNETRFCGTITNVGSGAYLNSGCYKEKIDGTALIREVCACEIDGDGYCNASFASTLTFSAAILATLLAFLIIAE